MKKDKYAKFVKWCEKWLNHYRHVLCLNQYRIHFSSVPTEDTGFRIHVDQDYVGLYIDFAEDRYEKFRKREFEDLKCSLLHELCHILVERLYFLGIERYTTYETMKTEWEKTTDHITTVIFRLLPIK